MKNFQVKGSITKLGHMRISEDHIKEMLANKLGRQLAENFSKDLQLKRDQNDKIHAVDYAYNLFILEVNEYNNIMFKLHKLIEYVKTKKTDDQLLYLLVDLKKK
jgi:hypothetical protein